MNASRQIGHGSATVLSPDAFARLVEQLLVVRRDLVGEGVPVLGHERVPEHEPPDPLGDLARDPRDHRAAERVPDQHHVLEVAVDDVVDDRAHAVVVRDVPVRVLARDRRSSAPSRGDRRRRADRRPASTPIRRATSHERARTGTPSSQHLPRDHQLLDLGRALVDPQRADLAVQALDRLTRRHAERAEAAARRRRSSAARSRSRAAWPSPPRASRARAVTSFVHAAR